MAAGVAGAALLQPPKSSSSATTVALAGPPVEAIPSLLPHPPKSSLIEVVAGALYVGVGAMVAVDVCFGGAAARVESGVDHALLDPHASKLPNPLDETAGGFDAAGCGAGFVRLNAEAL